MLLVEHWATYGWEAAARGMRNPMNSWAKADSTFEPELEIGPNDLALMTKLVKSGSDHRKFLRMIAVSVDITAPLYWWAEFDTYKVGTVRDSCSKMHKLMERPFEMSDFSFDKLFGYKNEVKQFVPDADETKEEWRGIGVPGYEVSSEGRIRHSERILSGSLHTDGYIFVAIQGKQIPLHRLVAKRFLHNPENKPEVNHIDGNKQNNRVSNLEWVTRSENAQHAVRMGLQPTKIPNYTGKFSPEERERIKDLCNNGKSRRQVAEMYGVSHTCICDIVNEKYKYVNRTNVYRDVARPLVDLLNELRDKWLECESETLKKEIWYSVIQLLPESYNQRATVTMNYEVIRHMYHARKNHKLDEWHSFCSAVEQLPYFYPLIQ